MHKAIIILTLLVLPWSVIAQRSVDVVYLKNGSIIKGNLVPSDNTETVKIETCCGNIFVFWNEEIIRTEINSQPDARYIIKKRGYFNFTSTGILLGSSTNERKAPFSLLSEHDYRINRYVATGFVIGYELLQEPVVPLAVSVKVFLPLVQSDLFLGVTTGYSFSIENPDSEFLEGTSGGYLFNTELGVSIPISENNSFFMAAGYRYNKLKYARTDPWLGEVKREVFYNRLSIRLGISIY
jgi:hypothetical protein